MTQDNDSPKFGILDHAFRDMMLEVEHQMRTSRNNFFGNVKLELTYNNGTLSFVRVSSERTMKSDPDKQSGRPRLTQG
jgi:hypothetical protein